MLPYGNKLFWVLFLWTEYFFHRKWKFFVMFVAENTILHTMCYVELFFNYPYGSEHVMWTYNRWRGASSFVLNFDLAIFLLRTKLVVLILYSLLFHAFTTCLNSFKVNCCHVASPGTNGHFCSILISNFI